MDISSVIGLVLGMLLIFGPIIMSGLLMAFVDVGSMLIVVFGAISAMITSLPLSETLKIGKIMGIVFKKIDIKPNEIIDTLVNLGEKARREGILALERELKAIDNDFMKKAIQMAVDGNEVEIIEGVMETEIEYIEKRHKKNKDIFDSFGSLAPAYGMIGTLVGLIQMLQNLEDPSQIGLGMAVALVTTFYGSLLANWIFIPMANKLGAKSEEELLMKQLVLGGVVSIQSGDNPRILREKLETYIAPQLRKGSEE